MNAPHALGPFSWHVPIPTRRGAFTALDPEFAHCDRVTDIGAIAAFSVPKRSDRENVAWADFQLPQRHPSNRCPGSGRAGVFKGWYLKGIGRTQFCWNWHVESTVMHGSGHMFPSAAVRELLGTSYARARGLGHALVPCESLLLRPLEPEFAAALSAYADKNEIELCPLDRKLQAITVKPANFLRWSNLLAAARFANDETDAVIEIARALLAGCSPHAPVDSSQTSVTDLLAAVRGAVARGLQNFIDFDRAGLYWHSYNNNISLDGRFLDLELPTVLAEGRPCALSYYRPSDPQPTRVDGRATICAEAPLHYVAQTRAGLEQLAELLVRLADRSREVEVERYARELGEGLLGIAKVDSAIASDEALFDRLLPEWVRGGGDVERLSEALNASITEILRGGPSCHYPDPEQDADFIELAAVEPGVRCRAFYPKACGSAPSDPRSLHMVASFNAALERIDALEQVDETLAAVRDARAEIAAFARPEA